MANRSDDAVISGRDRENGIFGTRSQHWRDEMRFVCLPFGSVAVSVHCSACYGISSVSVRWSEHLWTHQTTDTYTPLTSSISCPATVDKTCSSLTAGHIQKPSIGYAYRTSQPSAISSPRHTPPPPTTIIHTSLLFLPRLTEPGGIQAFHLAPSLPEDVPGHSTIFSLENKNILQYFALDSCLPGLVLLTPHPQPPRPTPHSTPYRSKSHHHIFSFLTHSPSNPLPYPPFPYTGSAYTPITSHHTTLHLTMLYLTVLHPTPYTTITSHLKPTSSSLTTPRQVNPQRPPTLRSSKHQTGVSLSKLCGSHRRAFLRWRLLMDLSHLVR